MRVTPMTPPPRAGNARRANDARLIPGFLGGLTTFSSFSAESVELLGRGEWGWAGLHLAGHLLGSLLATWCGMLNMRYWLQG